MDQQQFPLDLERTGYAYLERHNTAILGLLTKHLALSAPRILDLGCGAGANARAIRATWADARITGVEPDVHACKLAREVCSEVFQGTGDQWLASNPKGPYDAVILSDVLEHLADPVGVLRSLMSAGPLKGALWIISVPNYAVWYNRIRTLAGLFEYAWSGLYDRTHLRFFTSASLGKLLDYVGFNVVDEDCTPSIVQSAAPLLRRLFDDDLARGQHLALGEASSFKVYSTFVEPLERRICRVWPALLAFQIVVAARVATSAGSSTQS